MHTVYSCNLRDNDYKREASSMSEDGDKGSDNNGERIDMQRVKWRLIKSFAATSGG